MADQPTHRSLRDPTLPDTVELREVDEDGMMEIRLPIASTGEVRNEDDDPLSRAELEGMAEQINSNTLGVFPEHGQSDKIDFAGYSQFEKLGYWTDGEVEPDASADGEDVLFATARMIDPEPLPSQAGTFREGLAILKEQAVRGVPISTSIGWREDPDSPGGNDLMEISISGLQADPRTVTEGGEALVARAAVAAGADPEELVRTVRDAVEDANEMTDTDDTDTEPDEEQTTDREEDGGEESLSADEFRAEMIDLQRQQMDTLETLAEAVRQEDEDDEDDEDDGEDDDEDEENASDEPDEEQGADDEEDADDGERGLEQIGERLDSIESELASVRSGETDIETPDPDADGEERDADDDTETETETERDPAEKPDWLTID